MDRFNGQCGKMSRHCGSERGRVAWRPFKATADTEASLTNDGVRRRRRNSNSQKSYVSLLSLNYPHLVGKGAALVDVRDPLLHTGP